MFHSVTTTVDGFARGTRLLRAGQCEEALDEFRAVYAQADLAGDGELMGACLCEMAWSCYKLGKAEMGLECAMAAKWLRQRQNNSVELARAMSIEAILFLDLGFTDEAFGLMEQAVALAEAGDHPAVLAFALNAKGIVVAICREIVLGISLIERAVQSAVAADNTAAEAYYVLNLGFCHAKIAEEADTVGEPDRAVAARVIAIDLFDHAIAQAEASGDLWTLRAALGNCAEMHGLLGHYDTALAHLARNAALPGDPGASMRIHYLYTLGDVLKRSGQLQQAHDALSEALALAESGEQIDHLVNTARLLAETYEALGDTSGALAHFKRFHRLHVKQSGETARRRARIEEIRSETEQLRSRAEILADQANSDALTGIANRRSFDNILNRLAGSSITLAIVDLDHFKLVNDRFSHIVGDAVLQRVAKTLVAQLGPHGHAARLGGEEFALVFPNAPISIAAAFCEAIRIAIATTDWSDLAPGLAVSVSIGVAAGDGATPSGTIMQTADTRLYIAKSNGRDCVVSSDPALSATADQTQRLLA